MAPRCSGGSRSAWFALLATLAERVQESVASQPGTPVDRVREAFAQTLDQTCSANMQRDLPPLSCECASGWEFVNLQATDDSIVFQEAPGSNDVDETETDSSVGARKVFDVPTFILGDVDWGQSRAEWLNTALAGREFVHTPHREPNQTFTIHALEDVSVEVEGDDGCVRVSKSMTEGQQVEENGDCTGKPVRITSTTGRILVAVRGSQSRRRIDLKMFRRRRSVLTDIMPLAPASSTVYGDCSKECYVSMYSGPATGDVLEECSDGTTSIRNFSKMFVQGEIENHEGKVCKWTARSGTKISGSSHGDGNGWDGISFLPSHLFQTETPVPQQMTYLKIFSDVKANCSYRGGEHQFTLEGQGPYKYRLTDLGNNGGMLRCDAPVSAFGDAKEKQVQMILANCA